MMLSRRLLLSLLLALATAPVRAQVPNANIPWARISPDYEEPVLGSETRFVADLSGDDRWILAAFQVGYLSPSAVVRLRSDGSAYEQLTFPDSTPWSDRPGAIDLDGDRVVFVRGLPFGSSYEDLASGDAMLLDVPSGTFKNLSHLGTNGLVWSVDISWDGKTVAWRQAKAGEGRAIYSWREGKGPALKISDGLDPFGDVVLSADGTLALFMAQLDKPPYPRELFVAPTDGSQPPKRITFLQGEIGHYSMDAAGEHVVFDWFDPATEIHYGWISHVRTDGSDLMTLVTGGPNLGFPRFPKLSPDGSVLVFFVYPPVFTGMEHFFRLDLQSGSLSMLDGGTTGCQINNFPAAVSRDGTFIVSNVACIDYEGTTFQHAQVYVADTRLPHLVVAGALEPGTTPRFTLTGDPDTPAFLFVSTGTAQNPLPGVGTFLLDPNACFLLDHGRFDAFGSFRVDTPIPTQIPLQQLYFQGVSTQPPGFSNLLTLEVQP